MSGDTSRKGGENSIFGPAIAEFANAGCTVAATIAMSLPPSLKELAVF